MQLFPQLEALIPAMLDRCDPNGRKLILMMASSDSSPKMLEILKNFALSDRGSSETRLVALNNLFQQGHIGGGPHRFYSNGTWNEILLNELEIYDEPLEEPNPWESELTEKTLESIDVGDFDQAEVYCRKILNRAPESAPAQFNLAMIWISRDGEAGKQRAMTQIREIHEKHPDHIFSTLVLAVSAAQSGDDKEAARLLKLATKRRKLHVSEASAMFAAQFQIALLSGEIQSAESSLSLLETLWTADDPRLEQFKEMLAVAKRPIIWQRLLHI